MNRREFIGQGAAGVASVTAAMSGSARALEIIQGAGGAPVFPVKGRPNIVFITCHDLGRHLGCYGARTVDSPRLDALAAEGVRFARSFCVAPQCSPSRATMFTGQYPHSNGVMGLAHDGFAWALNPGSRPLAAILRDAGWHTALAGGQHATHDPAVLGFEEMGSGGQFRPCSEVADQCVRFLARQTPASRPFYLEIGFFEPHRPFDFGGAVADSTRGVSVMPYLVDDAGAREECAALQGAIKAVDRAIGRVLDVIDALGLREDTLLVFTTDHGIAFPRAKCAVYDAGLETCLILRWPAAGWKADKSVDSTLLSNVDYAPTVLDLIGLPPVRGMQGRSFAGLLRGEAYRERTEIFAELTYHDYYDPRRCIRTATHKLIVNFCNAYFFMDPSQEWFRGTITRSPADPAAAYHVPVELYDLVADPGETVNLAASAPHRAVRGELLSKLRRWMEETRDPLLHGIPPAPIHRRALAALNEAYV